MLSDKHKDVCTPNVKAHSLKISALPQEQMYQNGRVVLNNCMIYHNYKGLLMRLKITNSIHELIIQMTVFILEYFGNKELTALYRNTCAIVSPSFWYWVQL